MLNNIIPLKDSLWLARQKRAGRCVAQILKECGNLILKGDTISLRELENVSRKIFDVWDCTPTFYNYRGFPSLMCTSVNKQLVHGIATDYILNDGDIVSVDVGATFEGAIADAARTWIFGTPKCKDHVELVKVGEEALLAAKKSIAVGKNLGVIGNTIYSTVKKTRFNVIENYGGHGMDYNKPHSDPFVLNKSRSDDGIMMMNGLSIAVEPMIVIGDPQTKVLDDGWTVVCNDVSCHFEDSFTLFDNEVHHITEII